MDNKGEKIKKLKIRLEEIEPILNKRFKTSKELHSHMEKNKKIYEEGKNLFAQIQQLEWELMTPEEKEEREKYLRFLELKAKGEPFDPEEEGLL